MLDPESESPCGYNNKKSDMESLILLSLFMFLRLKATNLDIIEAKIYSI